MLHPKFFYTDQSDIERVLLNSFHIDHIANNCTEERRLMYKKISKSFELIIIYVASHQLLCILCPSYIDKK